MRISDWSSDVCSSDLVIALVPAVAGALIVAGVIGLVVGLKPAPVRPPRSRPVQRKPMSAGMKRLLLVGVIGGCMAWLVTGWALALVAVPLACVGVPMLLSNSGAAARIDRLEAMEEWTRSLSGVLTVGIGLEQALVTTERSTPSAIRPEVQRLVARLRSRWNTEEAIRAFADELDDATGDLVAANLILAARRRGAGLAPVLESLAESVAADVRARRQIEADRATPPPPPPRVPPNSIGRPGILP